MVVVLEPSELVAVLVLAPVKSVEFSGATARSAGANGMMIAPRWRQLGFADAAVAVGVEFGEHFIGARRIDARFAERAFEFALADLAVAVLVDAPEQAALLVGAVLPLQGNQRRQRALDKGAAPWPEPATAFGGWLLPPLSVSRATTADCRPFSLRCRRHSIAAPSSTATAHRPCTDQRKHDLNAPCHAGGPADFISRQSPRKSRATPGPGAKTLPPLNLSTGGGPRGLPRPAQPGKFCRFPGRICRPADAGGLRCPPPRPVLPDSRRLEVL